MALKTLLLKRAALRGKITRITQKEVATLSATTAKSLLTSLEKYQDEFERNFDDMILIDDEANHEQRQTEFTVDMDRIDSYKFELLELINDSSSSSTSTAPPPSVSTMSQPSFSLPKFTGDSKKWNAFADLFLATVNDSGLSPAQKLQLLKSSTTDKAARILEPFTIMDANYEPAWRALEQRFKDLKTSIYGHIDSIIQHGSVRDTSRDIDAFVDVVRGACLAMEGLQRPIHNSDLIVRLLETKLSTEIQRAWRFSLQDDNPPTYQQLIDFLTRRAKQLVEDQQIPPKPHMSNGFNKKQSSNRPVHKASPTNQAYVCPACGRDHRAVTCELFKNMSTKDRRLAVRNRNLCFNCLRPGHMMGNCTSDPCKKCHERHHTLLHDASTQVASMNADTDTLLPTANIDIKAGDGSFKTVRALLDTGSMACVISKNVATMLKLQTVPVSTKIICVGNKTCEAKQSVKVHIKSLSSDYETETTALVYEDLSIHHPQQKLNTEAWSHIKDLKLADPNFNLPRGIDIILGVGVVSGMPIPGALRPPMNNLPWAHNTHLGWIVYGQLPRHSRKKQINTALTTDIKADFQQLWELDQPVLQATNSEDKECEDLFKKTTIRRPDGSYTVTLPLKKNTDFQLRQTKSVAFKRLQAAEKKFKNNKLLKDAYSMQFQDYIDQGHMEKVPVKELQNNTVAYLPHHPVCKSDKLRIVFDASAATKTTKSLNEGMLKGPRVQDELFNILLRFRLNAVAFTADVKQMYRQIHIAEHQHDLHRVLWREDPQQQVTEYRMKRLTFGIKAAPFLATRTLVQLTKDEEKTFPLAAPVVRKDTYVDDIMTGADNPTKALELQRQVTGLLASGKFELQKWASNYPLLPSITDQQVKIQTEDMVSALGIRWHTAEDVFHVTYTFEKTKQTTKRTVLAQAARLFDPLGWLAPITIFGKMFLQRLWKLQLDWDTPLSPPLTTEWEEFIHNLPAVNNIKIPRFVETFGDTRSTLVGFADASEKAYAAVVYIRTHHGDKITTHLLASKTKVAPVKSISIPRLELAGALLLARLIHQVSVATTFPVESCFSDSEIVLSWIYKPSYNWKTFVANRVAEIQTLTNQHHWFHVQSTFNPADLATRSTSPQHLQKETLWWNGPQWLKNTTLPAIVPEIHQQHESKVQVHTITLTENFYEKYEHVERAVRVMAYVLRFTSKEKPSSMVITAQEYNNALLTIIRMDQKLHFPTEVKVLKTSETVPTNSSLKQLTPFLDNTGLLRVRSRLQNATIPYQTKNPIILSPRSKLTHMLVRQCHRVHLHGGTQLTLSNLRHKYWIPTGRRTVQKILFNCVRCRKIKAAACKQIMGNLPTERVTPSKPFAHTGVDYAGPLFIKNGGPRSTTKRKAYIAVFICLATRAVHLELVTELSTNAFIAALRRFVARRGYVSCFHSDNGTNFVGAHHELQEIADLVRKSEEHIVNELTPIGTTWRFIPPHAPHFGGLWEAGVKSVKFHLKRVSTGALLSYEEFTTVLNQIEACLNSRPLCPLSDDPEDFSPLTPGHFLTGAALTTPPDVNVLDIKLNRLNRWELLQKMTQDFWKRWSDECLTRMQNRPKWTDHKRDLQVGDVVVIKDNSLPPTAWKLGRVTSTYPGKDKKVRVVDVKTKDGVKKRPFTELALLPTTPYPPPQPL